MQRAVRVLMSFVVLCGVLALAGDHPTPAHAQPSVSCSGNFRVDRVLPTGTRWTMCWEVRSREGLVLREVTLTQPGQPSRLVLKQANLAQLHVPYDDNGARFHDVTDFGLGDANMLALTESDCRDGQIRPYNGKNVLCVRVVDRGLAYKSYANSLQGFALEISSISAVGAYNYTNQWKFGDDGSIEPGVGASGRLQRLSSTPSGYSWPLGPNRHGISHSHNYYWRLDFDLGTASNNRVEEFDFTVNGQSLIPLNITTFNNEVARQASATSFRSWRIKNTGVTNADGHPISYELLPESSQIFRGPSYEPFTQAEFYATQTNPCEQYASRNPTIGGCAASVDGFVNGQGLTGEDLVVWYGTTFHHLPRDEDDTFMDMHWSSFLLVPRDMAATNPLDTAVVTTVPQSAGCAPSGGGLKNGNFENADTDWLYFGSVPHAVTPAEPPARGGATAGYLGGYNNAFEAIGQTVVIPAGSTLSLWYRVSGAEIAANDWMVVRLWNGAGQEVATVAAVPSNSTPKDEWRLLTADLSPYACQTLFLQIAASTNGSTPTTYSIDDVRIS